MVFVRGLTGRTLNVSVATGTEVASFKTLLEVWLGLPFCHSDL